MSEGFFRVAAPFFGTFGDRWNGRQLEQMRDWLAPNVRPGGVLLDVGGGTGALATHLAEMLDARAIVVDPSEDMLSYLPDGGRVTGVLGTAENLPLDDSSVDAAVITDAFHHFPDQRAAARELARVVRCGGGVLVLEFDTQGWLRPLPWLERLFGEPGKFMKRDEMCSFFAEHGIVGRCERHGPISFRFVGSVEGTPDG